MLNWIKKKLRKWLEVETAPTEKLVWIIEALDHGQRVTYNVQGRAGMCLVGRDSSGSRLLREVDAVDRDHFWKLWNELAKGCKVTWEETEQDKLKK